MAQLAYSLEQVHSFRHAVSADAFQRFIGEPASSMADDGLPMGFSSPTESPANEALTYSSGDGEAECA